MLLSGDLPIFTVSQHKLQILLGSLKLQRSDFVVDEVRKYKEKNCNSSRGTEDAFLSSNA